MFWLFCLLTFANLIRFVPFPAIGALFNKTFVCHCAVCFAQFVFSWVAVIYVSRFATNRAFQFVHKKFPL